MTLEGICNASFPRQQRWGPFDHPPTYVNILREEIRATPGRVFNSGAFPPNSGSALSVPQLDSLYSFTTPEAFAFYRTFFGPTARLFMNPATTIPGDIILDAANIRYFVLNTARSDLNGEAEKRRFEKLYSDDYVNVFRHSGLNSPFFSSEYRVVPESRSLNELADLGKGQVILNRHPGFVATSNHPGDSQPRVLAKGLNSVTIDIRAPRPGLIYVSETNYPGWSATVNDKPVAVLTANHAFRAVPVPQGDVHVQLRYRPAGLKAGLSVTFFALTVVFWLGLRSRESAAKIVGTRTAESVDRAAEPSHSPVPKRRSRPHRRKRR
jgi:hypothetical protein